MNVYMGTLTSMSPVDGAVKMAKKHWATPLKGHPVEMDVQVICS